MKHLIHFFKWSLDSFQWAILAGAAAGNCQNGEFVPSSLGRCVDASSMQDLSACRSPSMPLGGSLNFSATASSSGYFEDGVMAALFCGSSRVPTISTCSDGDWIPPIRGCSSQLGGGGSQQGGGDYEDDELMQKDEPSFGCKVSLWQLSELLNPHRISYCYELHKELSVL